MLPKTTLGGIIAVFYNKELSLYTTLFNIIDSYDANKILSRIEIRIA